MTALAGWDGVADDMIPTATTLAFDVHCLDRAAVHDALVGLDVIQLRTLAVVLAGLVDIDRAPAELLAWLHDPYTPLPVRPEEAAEPIELEPVEDEPPVQLRYIGPDEAAENRRVLDEALSRRTA